MKFIINLVSRVERYTCGMTKANKFHDSNWPKYIRILEKV